MEFEPTEEQQQLRAAITSLLTDRGSAAEARRLLADAGSFDRNVWRELAADIGIAGLSLPVESGGAGGTFLDAVVAAEALGAGLYAGPHLATVGLALGVLRRCDDAAAVIGPLVEGRHVATLVLGDVTALWAPEQLTIRATRTGDTAVLHGVAPAVLHGAEADVLVVLAREDGRADPTVATLGGDARGVARRPWPRWDGVRPLATISFEGARAQIVASGVDTGPIAVALDEATVLLAAEALGAADRCFAQMVEHLRTRRQFGRPIGANQALQHRCADLAIARAQSRSALAVAAWEHAADGEARASVTSAAAAHIATTAAAVAYESVQVHGGMGFTWEHDAHLHVRRAESDRVLLGSPAEHLARYHDLVTAERSG